MMQHLGPDPLPCGQMKKQTKNSTFPYTTHAGGVSASIFKQVTPEKRGKYDISNNVITCISILF